MIKTILFDLDGLIIKKQEKMFSQRLSERVGFSWEKILEFFNGDFRECSFGRADLKEKILPYLEKWNYKGTVDDFLKFWFEGEGEIDKDVLDIVKSLRLKGIKCYISTRQEKYKKEYIWIKLNLKDCFDGIFCTCDIGCDKWQKEYWDYVFNNLKLKPEEVMFFCDSDKNIKSANDIGIEAYLYTGVVSLKDNLKKFL